MGGRRDKEKVGGEEKGKMKVWFGGWHGIARKFLEMHYGRLSMAVIMRGRPGWKECQEIGVDGRQAPAMDGGRT